MSKFNPVNFVVGVSFSEMIEKVYQNPNIVATCKELAGNRMYVSTKGLLEGCGIFKQWNDWTDSEYLYKIYNIFINLNQEIFSLTTTWYIYNNVEDLVDDLNWD